MRNDWELGRGVLPPILVASRGRGEWGVNLPTALLIAHMPGHQEPAVTVETISAPPPPASMGWDLGEKHPPLIFLCYFPFSLCLFHQPLLPLTVLPISPLPLLSSFSLLPSFLLPASLTPLALPPAPSLPRLFVLLSVYFFPLFPSFPLPGFFFLFSPLYNNFPTV